MRKASEVRLTGLAAVRITWITAIVVCVLAVVADCYPAPTAAIPRGSSPGSLSPTAATLKTLNSRCPTSRPLTQLLAGRWAVQKTAAKTPKDETAWPHGTRGQRVSDRAPGDSRSSPGDSHSRAGAPPAKLNGGRRWEATLVHTRAESAPRNRRPTSAATAGTVRERERPEPPQAPSVTVNVPDLPQPPQAPSGTSGVSLPQVSVNVSAPIQPPIVKVPDVSVQLP